MVYRVYTEKKNGLTAEADALTSDAKNLLMIDGIEKIRILNRYDVENIDPVLFERSKSTVFSEPQLDDLYDHIGDKDGCKIFAVEYLPGQFDQRADSASQCIQIISKGERPLVRTAKIYMIYGDV
ncbi:MAG: phosphoribosylformylglycinamidine synthase, partial [Acutalibacteraceae bacterium]